ncbi:MAG: D-tyrosyl-tRNA(Tyr) deacylase [Verrucomicrobia bacterium]|nr:D-tyrosyl-tRNA(Tyr) deacylase [Verrucomicrobiota bacterium]
MRAVIQRVTRAKVQVEGACVGSIGEGMVVFLGVGARDEAAAIAWLVSRGAKVRIWEDENGRMARSVQEKKAEVMVISQFTLYGSMKKGNRPSFNRAAEPAMARALYEQFVAALELELGRPVATGRFGAEMAIEVLNDGPVTLVVDSEQREF